MRLLVGTHARRGTASGLCVRGGAGGAPLALCESWLCGRWPGALVFSLLSGALPELAAAPPASACLSAAASASLHSKWPSLAEPWLAATFKAWGLTWGLSTSR